MDKFLDSNSMVRILKKNKKCNAIMYTASVLQINCSLAAIKYLEARGVSIDGYWVRLVSDTLGIETYKSSCTENYEGVKCIDGYSGLVYNHPIKDRVFFWRSIVRDSFLPSKNEKVYVIGAGLLYPVYCAIKKAYGNAKTIVYVEIDDGIANYMPYVLNYSINFFLRDRNNKYFVPFFLKYVRKGFGVFATYKLMGDSRYKQLTICKKKK